jgi:hypothetical protein
MHIIFYLLPKTRVIKSGAQGKSQLKIEIWSYLHIDGIFKWWDSESLSRSIQTEHRQAPQTTPKCDVEEEVLHKRQKGKDNPGEHRITEV